MTGQRIAAAVVWPLTAFLYFDSTAVYVHIVLTILHRSTKESYNSHLIILILIQNFMFIHKEERSGGTTDWLSMKCMYPYVCYVTG